FATSSTTSTLATNLAAAINACSTSFGVSASSSSTTTTVSARTNGTAGNSIGLGNTLSGFSWVASTLSGGTDGTNTGTNFATSADTTTEATNLKDAISRNVSAVTPTSSGAVVTVTANT